MSMTLPRPTGSELEESVLRHISDHLRSERSILEEYAVLAEESPDEYVRYLAGTILDDERRHHQRLVEMRNRIESDITWREAEPALPRVTVPADREQLAETIDRFIEIEEHDADELRRLRRSLRGLRDTTLLSLTVEVMELDTQKHLRILEFMRRSVAR